jgi:hypothetical protein
MVASLIMKRTMFCVVDSIAARYCYQEPPKTCALLDSGFCGSWHCASTPKTQSGRVFARTFPKTFFILEVTRMENKKVNSKKRLTAVEVKVIIESWNSKSLDEIAGQLGVTPNTVRMMVSSIRKVDPEKCPPKPRTRKVREDVVREALALLNSVAA